MKESMAITITQHHPLITYSHNRITFLSHAWITTLDRVNKNKRELCIVPTQGLMFNHNLKFKKIQDQQVLTVLLILKADLNLNRGIIKLMKLDLLRVLIQVQISTASIHLRLLTKNLNLFLSSSSSNNLKRGEGKKLTEMGGIILIHKDLILHITPDTISAQWNHLKMI